jgi:hypothetical protein
MKFIKVKLDSEVIILLNTSHIVRISSDRYNCSFIFSLDNGDCGIHGKVILQDGSVVKTMEELHCYINNK